MTTMVIVGVTNNYAASQSIGGRIKRIRRVGGVLRSSVARTGRFPFDREWLGIPAEIRRGFVFNSTVAGKERASVDNETIIVKEERSDGASMYFMRAKLEKVEVENGR